MSNHNTVFGHAILARNTSFIIIFLTAAILLSYSFYSHNSKLQITTDFAHAYLAGQAVKHHLNPYAPDELMKIAGKYGYGGYVYPHLYPPFVSTLLMYPMTFWKYQSALHIWYWCNIILLYLSFAILWLVFRTVALEDGKPKNFNTVFLLSSAVLLCCFYPICENFRWAQINIVIFFFLTLFLYCYFNGRSAIAGFCLSIIILIKIAPVLIWLYLLLLKKYRVFIYTAAALFLLNALSFIIIGFEHLHFYFNTILPTLSFGQPVYKAEFLIAGMVDNYSLNGFFSSLFVRSIFGDFIPWNHPIAGKIFYYSSILFLISDRIALSIKNSQFANNFCELIQFSNIIILYSLISIITYEHHFIVLCIPFLVLGISYIKCKPKNIWIILYVISVAIFSINIEKVFQHPILAFLEKQDQFCSNHPGLLYLLLFILPVKFYCLILLWMCGRNAEKQQYASMIHSR